MIKQVKIDEIQVPDWSFKNVDAEQYKSLRRSIKKNGQTKNLLVRIREDGKYELIDGRQVLSILKTMDVDFVWCKVFQGKGRISAMLLYLEHDFYFENNFIAVAHALKKINLQHSKLEISKHCNLNYSEVEELLNLADYDFSKFEVQNTSNQKGLF